MSKEVIHAVMITLFLLSISPLRSNIQAVRGEPVNIIVPDQHVKIQWAIGNATAGDTIFVRSGTYYEHLGVNKRLTLFGDGEGRTVVDGSGENRTVIEVTANNVVISGFTVQNSSRAPGTSYAGIKILGSACNITGNHVTRNKIGIFSTSQKSRIAENVVTYNGQGIALYDSSEVTVEANNATANTVGISLALSSNNMIVHNNVVKSSAGGHGITLSSNSLNNTILGNNLVNNGHGMWLSNSINNWIMENTIANNKLLGIELASSPDNTFYHNNFVNNPKHIVMDGKSISIWDNGYPSGGNYWHEYTNVDEWGGPNQDQPGSDEIWDNPYPIAENNQDRYPSVGPYGDISHIISGEGKLTAQAGPDQTVKMGTLVYFDASGSTGDIVSYEWDFGDGTKGTGVTNNHIYSGPGIYNVTFTVKDAAGNFDTDLLIVTVTADEASGPVNFSPPWISPLAVVMGVAIVAVLFWKYKISKKMRRKKMRKLRASIIDSKKF